MAMIQQVGDFGVFVNDGNTFSFSISGVNIGDRSNAQEDAGVHHLDGVNGFYLLRRGADNQEVNRIMRDVQRNRLLPSLIDKQVRFLYGEGPHIYLQDGNTESVNRQWVEQDDIRQWLEGWEVNGISSGYKEFARSIVKNYYYFRDFFVRWRFAKMPGVLGAKKVAGLESVENMHCRLATKKRPSEMSIVEYSDMTHVAYGNHSLASKNKFYPLFRLHEVDKYDYAAMAHYRETTPGRLYGLNGIYHGISLFLELSNDLPIFIRSFLDNSLAAKVHVIIPNAWVETKRQQLMQLCEENKTREASGKSLIKYEDIDLGTEYSETILIRYVQKELRKFSNYLSGAKNQGKAFSSFSFFDGNIEQRWKIENIELKYKEYIEAINTVDRRVDEVLLSSTGMDSSITAIAKPGMISKSGSDAYYNYLIYLRSLPADDEICCKPFNQVLAVNFPELYKQGYRVGFYRPIPAKQEETSPSDRIGNQECL